MGLGRSFKDCGNALAAANTHGFKGISALASVQFAQHVRENATARCADRMSEGNAGAIDVQSVIIVPTPAFEHRQDLTRKGFVQFNQIHILKTQAGAVKQLLNGRHRTNAMVAGWQPAAAQPTK